MDERVSKGNDSSKYMTLVWIAQVSIKAKPKLFI